ncbi:MAG: molybdenum cofactor biosynthesis protein MoaE [Actinomycetes bacterium]
MRVTVRLFAGLREQAGWGTKEIEADTVADVWDTLGLGNEPDGLLYAVNREYSPKGTVLADGDVVALIPPVSGGAFILTEEPVSLDKVVQEVATDEAGAVATFSGNARRHSRGRVVSYLDYEGYEGMAEEMMEKLADDLKERYDIHGVAIHHRVGRVQLGEPSVVIAVSASHRKDALAACKDAIDILKIDVPLWKKEVYEGGEEWIGRGS